eukprot:jgi/Mesvir1/26002/Mv25719-RA.1
MREIAFRFRGLVDDAKDEGGVGEAIDRLVLRAPHFVEENSQPADVPPRGSARRPALFRGPARLVMLWPGIRCGDGLVERPISPIANSRGSFAGMNRFRRGWRGRLQADFVRALWVICDPSVTGIPDALLDLALGRDAVRLVAGDGSPLRLGPSPLLAALFHSHRHLMTEH